MSGIRRILIGPSVVFSSQKYLRAGSKVILGGCGRVVFQFGFVLSIAFEVMNSRIFGRTSSAAAGLVAAGVGLVSSWAWAALGFAPDVGCAEPSWPPWPHA